MQVFETQVFFECPKCQKTARTSVIVPEPNWGAGDKMSDMTSEGETQAQCSECEAWFSAYVYNSASSCDVTLDEYPNTNVVADFAFFSPPDEEDWLDRNPPTDPYSVFTESMNQLAKFLIEHGENNGDHIVNRMIFTQQVSAFEAYLGDTLLRAVQAKPKALSQLLTKDTEVNAQKFTLAQVAANPNLVSEKVAAYLKSILYHNLAKVHFLYGAALNVQILTDDDDNDNLMKAIQYRHDCVHRNGKDNDGNPLEVFTEDYIRRTGQLMRALVKRIELEVWGPSPF